MTRIIFVRHAQPDMSWEDDRTRPKSYYKSTGVINHSTIFPVYKSAWKDKPSKKCKIFLSLWKEFAF